MHVFFILQNVKLIHRRVFALQTNAAISTVIPVNPGPVCESTAASVLGTETSSCHVTVVGKNVSLRITRELSGPRMHVSRSIFCFESMAQIEQNL